MLRRILVFWIVCLSACSWWSDAESIAKTATVGLIEDINESDLEGAYAVFGYKLQGEYTIEQAAAIFDRVHEETGVCETPELESWNTIVGTGDTMVTLTALAKCPKADLKAELTWRLMGDKPTLEAFSFSKTLGESPQ